MIFPTIEFAAFFVVVCTASWLLMPHPRLWKPFILLASYVFYGYADVRFCLLLAASTLLNAVAGQVLARHRDRRILIAVLAANLGLLGWFKYFGFFVLSVDNLLERIGLGAPLPLREGSATFFVGQLGKYVPGSVWSLGAQATLARRQSVPARVTVAAGLVFLGYHLATGVALGAGAVLLGVLDPGWPAWVSGLLVLGAVVGLAPSLVRALSRRLAGQPLRLSLLDTAGHLALMALGMMMMPPVMVSLPFKLLLFVMVDGWALVIKSLVASYGT